MAKRLFIPGPVTCAPSVLEAMAAPLVDHRGPEFAAVLGRISRGMKPVFATAGDVIVLGSSGTGGLEAALVNSFSPGQKLLACPVGLFGRRFASIATQYGFDVEILETPLGERVDGARLAQRLRQDREREFAGILLTHNETSTGVQNDMAALSQAIGDHPATVIVDSVSGLGASPFAMDEWRFDIVVGASQKALAAAPGLALLACSDRAWERMAGARAPRFYFDLRKARELGATGQTAWTPPVSIAFGLDAALTHYQQQGAEQSYARHDRYARTIRAFAQAAGLQTVSRPGAHSVTVVALFAPNDLNADVLRSDLREHYEIVVGGGQGELKGKILRIGTMGDISSDDVVGALDALATVLRDHGHPCDADASADASREMRSETLADVAS
ncbi:MAG: alanine--glyoxylate aminotransferase family protein [Candidatus Eremiobacteraeota bacterium]|nr:alanine--glyoxylate aminotransferase family protein [Candidatus Eremiobacteraeota bacterium]